MKNLGPTFKSLADVGPAIDEALAYATVYPFGQSIIDRGLRGDYMNLFVTIDLTKNRLKKTLGLGTRWGDQNLPSVPAPGDPGYDWFYTTNPLAQPVANPPSPPVRAPLPTGRDVGIPPDSPAAHVPVRARVGLMLTRFVRIQLAVFAIASIVGLAAMVIAYVQLPTLVGVGRITVTLELPAAGGLYRFANVTYRGVTIGKVTESQPDRDRR